MMDSFWVQVEWKYYIFASVQMMIGCWAAEVSALVVAGIIFATNRIFDIRNAEFGHTFEFWRMDFELFYENIGSNM